MVRYFAAVAVAILLLPAAAWADFPSNWSGAKRTAQREVYQDTKTKTFYCGCDYTPNPNSSSGGGSVDLAACGMAPLPKKLDSSRRIEWEHIVPASLMPARDHDCWDQSEQFPQCITSGGNVLEARDCCAKVTDEFRHMIYDLHNLAPAIGQVNQYRSNGRYGEIEGDADEWPGCEARDLGETAVGEENLFEPPDCMKGNVARVWLYMELRHGVEISDAEHAMFKRWSRADPVSPWEKLRDARINAVQGNHNPFVHFGSSSEDGNCSWEE